MSNNITIKKFLKDRRDTSIEKQFRDYLVRENVQPIVMGMHESFYDLRELTNSYENFYTKEWTYNHTDLPDYME